MFTSVEYVIMYILEYKLITSSKVFLNLFATDLIKNVNTDVNFATHEMEFTRQY